LIWIWPGEKEEADPDLIPDLNPNRPKQDEWSSLFVITVDLDIDHSLMVENLVDPAHLPFAHENTLMKRKDSRPLRMDTEVIDIGSWASGGKLREILCLRGRAIGFREGQDLQFHFVPPSFVALRSNFGKPGRDCKFCE
jgi:phenylpropionate dioxygenase-like ring-hydroxylating dioxygenase large terminal subunit